jgi:hypothetical protein
MPGEIQSNKQMAEKIIAAGALSRPGVMAVVFMPKRGSSSRSGHRVFGLAGSDPEQIAQPRQAFTPASRSSWVLAVPRIPMAP